LAAVLESSLGASFNPQGYALYRELILLLAEGQPVSPEHVASGLESKFCNKFLVGSKRL